MSFDLWKHVNVYGNFLEDDSIIIIKEYLENCKNTQVKPSFHLIPEGFSIQNKSAWKLIETLYQIYGFNHKDVTITTSDLSASYNCNTDIQPKFLHWATDWLVDKNYEFSSYTPITFMHFIGRLQWDRVYIHHEIVEKFSSKSYYRLHGYNDGKKEIGKCCSDLLERGFKHEEVIEIIRSLNHFPKGNISDSSELKGSRALEHQITMLQEYYNNAFLDIVHETDLSSENFFITEKTLRPMMFHRPFLLSAGKNYLRKLHGLGFKTFGSWWSEDYDMYDGKERLRSIRQIIRQLSTLTLDQMRAILKEMRPLLEHNYKVLKNRLYKK